MTPQGASETTLLGVLFGKGERWQCLLYLGVALAPLLLDLHTRKGR